MKPARAERLLLLFLPVVFLLFLIANRGAYQGYFMDDDLDNIAWTRGVRAVEFVQGFLDPRYAPNHFRPTAHFAYSMLANTAGLNYRWYVGLIHALHFANTLLLWSLLRRLNLPPGAAGVGALFFLFHMALFDALWKPMYQFDVWCALFSLLSLHAWMSRRWVFSFLAFWAAYKSKEHAVMLPAALAAYEWWLGEKRWRPLIAPALAALSFSLQALVLKRHEAGDYRMELSVLGLARTTVYYMTRVLLLPYAGLLLLLLPRRVRDRRLWFGLAFGVLMLAPMLALPARLSGAYLYLPMAGIALAIAVTASRLHWAFAAVFFLVWLPLNFQSLRDQRKAALTYAHENRAYVEGLSDLPSRHPGVYRFIYDGAPPGLRPWGIRGALRFLYRREDIELYSIEEQNLRNIFVTGPVALLNWDAPRRQLATVGRAPDEPDTSHVRMARPMPVWQLEEGWYALEGHYRWSKPVATARLYRPEGARQFAVKVLIGPQLIAGIGRGRLEVVLDGEPVGAAEYTEHGWRTYRFALQPASAGTVQVEFRATPPFQPSPADRVLGVAFGGFGFVTDREDESWGRL
jgi:hypothetical protein